MARHTRPMAMRRIEGFERDEDGAWVARLDCGHPQHVRHDPPWQVRPWVQAPDGRADKIGFALDCPYCDMPVLPAGAQVYRCTPAFDETTVPDGLKRAHRTREGAWGRIVVESGKLRYTLEPPRDGSWVLRPGIPGIIEPRVEHHVVPVGEVRFRVEFLRAPDPDGKNTHSSDGSPV